MVPTEFNEAKSTITTITIFESADSLIMAHILPHYESEHAEDEENQLPPAKIQWVVAEYTLKR